MKKNKDKKRGERKKLTIYSEAFKSLGIYKTTGGDENKYGMEFFVCMYGDQCMVYGVLFIHTYVFAIYI